MIYAERRYCGAFSCGFACGDVVARKDDERHEGTVISVWSHRVHVQWNETKWHEYGIDPNDLMLVKRFQAEMD